MKKYLVKTYTEKDSLVGEAIFDTMEEAAGHLEQRLQERPDCWGKIAVLEEDEDASKGTVED